MMSDTNILARGFDTRPIEMQPMWLMMFQAPEEDVDPFDAIVEVRRRLHRARPTGTVIALRPASSITGRARARPPGPKRRPAIVRMSTKCASSSRAIPRSSTR